MNNKKKRKILAGAYVISVLIPLQAHAVDVGATAEIAAGRTDNIARTSSNEIDEDIVTVGLSITVSEQSQNVTADIQGRVVRFNYLDNTFDDETLATFNGDVVFSSTNSVFSWLIQDIYGQQIVDVFRPVTPNNRENVNIFTTGPDLRLPLGQQNSIVLNLRYTDMNYEVRPQDNDRRSASVQFVRQSTPTRTMSLVVTGDEIRYDDQTVNADLQRTQAYGQLAITSPRTTLVLDVGWVDIESTLVESDGLLASFTLNRQTSPFGNVSIQAGTRFSEAGDVFREFQQPGDRGVGVFDVDVTSDVEDTSDPFRLNYANVGYQLIRDRTTFGIGAGWREEDFENRMEFNRSLSNINANIERRVSPRFRVQGSVQFSNRDFANNGQNDDDLMFILGLGWDIGPRLRMDLELTRLDRDSNVLAASFVENRVFLTFAYELLLSAANP